MLPHSLMHRNHALENTEPFHHWILLLLILYYLFFSSFLLNQAQSDARWSNSEMFGTLNIHFEPESTNSVNGPCCWAPNIASLWRGHRPQATWASRHIQEWNGSETMKWWEHWGFFFFKLVIFLLKWADFLPYKRRLSFITDHVNGLYTTH